MNRFLVNDQRDAQIIFHVFISIYNSLHVSNTSCSSSGETYCINTASGNSHSMLVAEMCAGWKKSLLILICFFVFWTFLRVCIATAIRWRRCQSMSPTAFVR